MHSLDLHLIKNSKVLCPIFQTQIGEHLQQYCLRDRMTTEYVSSNHRYSGSLALGVGSFGRVVEVADENDKKHACKIVNKIIMKQKNMEKFLEREIAIHPILKHQNIGWLRQRLDQT